MIFTYQNFHGMISVFDELDSGVGGRIGTQIGEALRQLTKSGTQVICVTHLPQVAACGDLHLRVSKQIPFGLKDHASVLQCVEINVDTLNEEARIHEISSMLGLGNGQDSKEMAKCLLEATHSDETK
jgi:DNA repair protein RecN (Recombination protein N)